MNIEQYLQPTNPVACVVVGILIFSFVFWLIVLMLSWQKLHRSKKVLSSCKDITKIRQAVMEAHTPSSKDSSEVNSLTKRIDEAQKAFKGFLQKKNLLESDAIATHLKTIFNAGINETRLDAGELLRHTTQLLFTWTPFLRGLLGLFIVLGLFGTLIGLADSVTHFSQPLQTSIGSSANEQIRQSIGNLLNQLKGAFSPSIWGVGLTVLGVLLFSLYLRCACNPIQSSLDHLTVSVWIPQLLPTTPQRLVETLQLSEAQMRQSFEAARKVADFAQEVQNQSGEFNANLKSSNKVLKQLSEIGASFSGLTDKFVEGTNKLTAFQEDLRSLYQDALSNSTVLRDNVKEALADAQKFNKTVSDNLHKQGAQLEAIVTSLRSYESAYISQRQSIDQDLLKVLNTIYHFLLHELPSMNEQLVQKYCDPLIEKVDQKLSALQNTLEVKLSAIIQQYQKLQDPLTQAAAKIEGTFATMDRRTDTIINSITNLQKEMGKSRSDEIDHLKKTSDLIIKQNDVLNSLKNSISGLAKVMNPFLSNEKARFPDSKPPEPLTPEDAQKGMKKILKRFTNLFDKH